MGLRPRIPVTGEVVFDGPPPATPVEGKIRVAVQAITRTERGNAQVVHPR